MFETIAEADVGGFVYAVGSLIVLAAAGWIGVYWKRRRRRVIRRVATTLGFELSAESPGELGFDLGRIKSYNSGWQREALYVMRGTFGGREVIALDFHYTDRHASGYQDYFFSGCVFALDGSFPVLLIRPEVARDGVAAVVGLEDVDFESDEFSRKFYVQSPKREFAYDVCHPLMMEWLLANPDWKLEFGGRCMSITDGRRMTRWSLAEFKEALSAACEFLDRVPEFVWTKHDGNEPQNASWLSSTLEEPEPQP